MEKQEAEDVKIETCANCRFVWVFHSIHNCRRYPPRSHVYERNGNVASSDSFPLVKPDMWCGEYQSKDGE